MYTIGVWALLLVLPFATMAAVNHTHGAASHRLEEVCTRHCHDRGCSHVEAKYDWDRPIPRAARAIYMKNIELLRAPSLGYKNTNLAVYVAGAPTAFGILLLLAMWPKHRRPLGLREVVVAGVLVATVGALLATAAVHVATVEQWMARSAASSLYWYCTDFCIHAANGLGIAYEEFNFVLFVVGFPVVGVSLIAAVLWRLIRR